MSNQWTHAYGFKLFNYNNTRHVTVKGITSQMNDPNTPNCSEIYNIITVDERSLYLKMHNFGFDKLGIEEVIESFPLLHFQTLLRTKNEKERFRKKC